MSQAATVASDKRRVPVFLMCLLIGYFGVHRFYVGKWATGLLMIITLGGLGVWYILDCILIACGLFKDAEGRPITEMM